MSEHASKLLLIESLGELEAAMKHLEFSFQSISKINSSISDMNEQELEVVDAYTSRFSRVVDLLISKTLRALDRYELVDSLTLLDVVNRAEKRGLVPSADWLRELKDTRNRISHDYSGSQMKDILIFCTSRTKELIDCCHAVTKYSKTLMLS